jgi:hypothetical protein
MINLEKFREDLRSGKSLDDVLKDHNLDIKTAMELLIGFNRNVKEKKKRKSYYSKTNQKYVSKIGNKFYLRKTFNGKLKTFGKYSTVEDAVKVRDYLDKHGWYRNRLKSVWEACEVEGEW